MDNTNNDSLENREEVWDRFGKDEAAANFKELAKRFYDRNFGTLPKSEIDLLMFGFYFDHASNEKNKSDTEKNGWSYRSDLEIALQLGTTPTKVSNLREKMDLRKKRYDDDWRTTFMNVISKSNPLIQDDCVRFVLPDKYSKDLVEDSLMHSGLFYEYTLNSKGLSLPPETLFSLTMDYLKNERELSAEYSDDELRKKAIEVANRELGIDIEDKLAVSEGDDEDDPTFTDVIFQAFESVGAVGALFGLFPDISEVAEKARTFCETGKKYFVNRFRKSHDA